MQSLVDGALKAVFSGVVVAGAAVYVLGKVEESLELSRQRAALQELRNDTLSQTVTDVSEAYGALTCARQAFLLLESECKTGIDSFILLLLARKDLLNAIIPDGDFSSIASVVEVAQRMQGLQSEGDRLDKGAALTGELSANFIKMVNAVAHQFR